MKPNVFVILLMLAVSACTSMPTAQLPEQIPKLQATPAWILEPGPSLTPLLDKLISTSEMGSTPSKASSPPAKAN